MLCDIKTHVEHANHVKFMVLPLAYREPASCGDCRKGMFPKSVRLKAKRKVSYAFVSYVSWAPWFT